MKPKKNIQIKYLPDTWFKNISKQEIANEEEYNLLSDPSCKDWIGLKTLYTLATRELGYYGNISTYNDSYVTDLEPILQTTSVKTRLLNIAISRSELLSFNEIRVLNMLLDYTRKEVADQLGIKKSRLSQIIKNIKTKLERDAR